MSFKRLMILMCYLILSVSIFAGEISSSYCISSQSNILRGGVRSDAECIPFTESQADFVAFDGTVQTIAGSGTIVALGFANRVDIYEMSDPFEPFLMHTKNIYGPAKDMIIVGNRLIIAVENGIDSINLDTFAYTHKITYGSTKSMRLYNGKIYVGDGQGIKVIDPLTLNILQQKNTSGDVKKIEILNGVIYTFEWAGLKRFNLATLASITTSSYNPSNVELRAYENDLYAASGNTVVKLTFNGSTVVRKTLSGDKVELRNNHTMGQYTFFPDSNGLRMSLSGEIVVFEDANFESCIRNVLGIPWGAIFQNDIDSITNFVCDQNIGVNDIRFLPNGIDAEIDGVSGKIISKTFIRGEYLFGTFVAGKYLNQKFVPGLQGPRGFMPGILINEEKFVHGVYDSDGKFHPGMFAGDQFVPGMVINNWFVPGLVSDNRFIPGTFTSENTFLPGVFKDNGFIPGIVTANNAFIPGTFQNGNFTQGSSMDAGDALLLDQLGSLGGINNSDAFWQTGGYSKGNGAYDANMGGWMPDSGVSNGAYGPAGNYNYGNTSDGFNTGGHYEPGIGWIGASGQTTGDMGPGYGGIYDSGSGKLMPGYTDDYSSYVGAESGNGEKAKSNADGSTTTTTTTTETTKNADGSTTTTTTTTTNSDNSSSSKTTQGEKTEASNGETSVTVTETYNNTDSNGNSTSTTSTVMSTNSSEAGEMWKNLMCGLSAGGAAWAIGGLWGVAAGAGVGAACWWLTHLPSDPYGDNGNPYALNDDFMPADPWSGNGSPYARGNNCTPADPWDNGGSIFHGAAGYPADVDGVGGTIFYNDQLTQM